MIVVEIGGEIGNTVEELGGEEGGFMKLKEVVMGFELEKSGRKEGRLCERLGLAAGQVALLVEWGSARGADGDDGRGCGSGRGW